MPESSRQDLVSLAAAGAVLYYLTCQRTSGLHTSAAQDEIHRLIMDLARTTPVYFVEKSGTRRLLTREELEAHVGNIEQWNLFLERTAEDPELAIRKGDFATALRSLI